ncbi:sigma factor-like helix-turn-helix DNA-binding protein, partial [Sphingomonas fennica]|uniref:sigma factor-like helix-turn-helix DNA-binding protein n=1 Tax=Edaphosphingomonas fennica TaxID=114404 RepID=UPI002481E253
DQTRQPILPAIIVAAQPAIVVVAAHSTEEAAAILDIPRATVKTRNFRARRRLRASLAPELRSALVGTFPFAGHDCAAMTERVIAQWCPQPSPPGPAAA